MKQTYCNTKFIITIFACIICAVLITACTKANTYNVTYSAKEGGYIVGNTSQNVLSGNDCTTVEAIANDGYIFKGWSDSIMTAERTDTNITESKEISALFEKAGPFTVTYIASEGGYIKGDKNQTVIASTDCSAVEAVANEGFEFKGWSDGVTSALRNDVNIAESKNITAYFEKLVITLEYINTDGGSIRGTLLQEVSYKGNGIQVTAIPNEYYEFVQWSDGVTTPWRIDYNVVESKQVYPIYKMLRWSITYKSNYIGACIIPPQGSKRITAPDSTISISIKPNYGFKFVGWSDGVTTLSRTDTSANNGAVITAIFEPDYLDVPVLIINTENSESVISKIDYVPCTVSLMYAGDKFDFTDASAGIRTRGNSTNVYPKKPYRIKFNKKTSMFGSPKNKSWVLLAMYQDYSNIKDYAAFKFADAVGTNVFVPSANHVELYLNGKYMGLYLLTDQIDENEGRTNVKTDFSPDDVSIPFLVEWDEYAKDEGIEGVDWFKIANYDWTNYFNIKYPEADERYSEAQFDYVENYIKTVNQLCRNPYVTREEFEEYIDLDSFIDYYLIQEFMGQGEINRKSVFMSKTVDGKLVMGPVWDFDWAATGTMVGWLPELEQWFSTTNWFAYMYEVDWFKEALAKRWNEMIPILLDTIDELKEYKNVISPAAKRNFSVWDWVGSTKPELQFSGYYDKVIRFFYERMEWMSSEINSPSKKLNN